MATKKNDQSAADKGANALVDYLAATGTGREKLEIAKEAIVDLGEADTEAEGAQEVVKHLRRRGVTDGTVAKAEEFIEGGMKPVTVSRPAFDPNATIPGSVPSAAPSRLVPDKK